MRFQFRVLLAMMIVVSAAVAGTLYLSEQTITTTHERMFEQQFGSRIDLHSAEQEGRLQESLTKALRFSRLVRLRSILRRCNEAMEAGDSIDFREAAGKLYQTAQDELRELMVPPGEDPDAPAAVLLRLMTANGRLVPPPSSLADLPFAASADRLIEDRLSRSFRSGSDPSNARIGYLALPDPKGGSRLLEILHTPVIDPIEGALLGVLVLGFIAPESVGTGSVDSSINSSSRSVRGGVWLEGSLYSNSLFEEEKRTIEAPLLIELTLAGPAEGTLDVDIRGEPFRVFYSEVNRESGFPRAWRVASFSLQAAHEELADLRRRTIGYGLLAFAVAALFSALLAHEIALPIRDLVAGTQAVEEGNLSIQVRVRGRNEIGRLTEAFNHMVAGLALKEKYRNLLSLVADKGIAEELLKGKVALGGEQREISVLFCDIRGFTPLTRHMAPAEVVRLLNEHFTPLTRLVYEHQGVVDKFVGDLIMAVFGAPKSQGNDALSAARCARQMIEARRSLNQTAELSVEIGIGIASGPALAGCMGSSDRLSYTVLGERVNLASRLCGYAGKMEVVIDRTTHERLGDEASVEELPPVQLKGYTEPVQAFRLNAVGEAPRTPGDASEALEAQPPLPEPGGVLVVPITVSASDSYPPTEGRH